MPPAAHNADPAAWQQHLDFMLPRSATLRVDQIAAAAGVDGRTVERAFEGPAIDPKTGKTLRPWLLGWKFNAGAGRRFTRRIPRDAAILWLAACANYAPEDFLDRICEVLARRGARELLIIQGRVAALLKQKQENP
jgi:hypothetical protein